MVTIVSFKVRETLEGKSFITLELSGDIELIQSGTTGNFYATAKKCSMSCTFTEEQAKMLVGKQLPGHINRIETAAYDYTIKNTGEVITLNHTYEYNPEEKPKKVPEGILAAIIGR
jgi:hypothetical protein